MRIDVAVFQAANWLVDGPKRIFNDVGATSDVLKLVQKVNELFLPFVEITPLQPISAAVRHVTDFIGARGFIGRIAEIVSGDAAWTNPFDGNTPNFLRLSSKIVFLVGDISTTLKWLSSIDVLDKWFAEGTARIATWGNEFKVLKGVGDVSCVAGSLLSIADTARLVMKEMQHDRYVRNGHIDSSLIADHVLDVASDITKISAAVLSNIPGVHVVFVTSALAIGAGISIGKFYKKTNWTPVPHPIPFGLQPLPVRI